MNRTKLFPYITPREYPRHESLARPLGHDVYVQLVEDVDGLCTNVDPDSIRKANLTADKAHALALENLERLRGEKFFKAEMFTGPGGRPFIVWYGHWLAASCLVLPSMREWAGKNLKVEDLCASIPHRESMLMFPEGDRAFRDQMRQTIKENEGSAPKQITWELFSLTPKGIAPFVER